MDEILRKEEKFNYEPILRSLHTIPQKRRDSMDYAIVGGDVRFAYLTRLLCLCGYDARAVDGVKCDVPGVLTADRSELNRARTVVMNWPSPGGEEMLKQLPQGTSVIFCGPGKPENVPEGFRSLAG